MFISILHMFRAGEIILPIGHLVYVTLYRWPFDVQTCTLNGHRTEINIHERELCIELVIYKDSIRQFILQCFVLVFPRLMLFSGIVTYMQNIGKHNSVDDFINP